MVKQVAVSLFLLVVLSLSYGKMWIKLSHLRALHFYGTTHIFGKKLYTSSIPQVGKAQKNKKTWATGQKLTSPQEQIKVKNCS